MLPAKPHLKRGAAFISLVLSIILSPCVLCRTAQAQPSSSIHVRFSFPAKTLKNIQPTFKKTKPAEIQNEISQALAQICKESLWLKHWTYDTEPEGMPRLDVSVIGDPKGAWQMIVELKHQPDLSWQHPRIWVVTLRVAEDTETSGLPIDRAWLQPITQKFARMLDISAIPGKKMLEALKYFVPLGTHVATLHDGFRPGAVLGLPWAANQDLKTCWFRIEYTDHESNKVILIHSAGAGAAKPFRPDHFLYDALWVQHDTWREGRAGR